MDTDRVALLKEIMTEYAAEKLQCRGVILEPYNSGTLIGQPVSYRDCSILEHIKQLQIIFMRLIEQMIDHASSPEIRYVCGFYTGANSGKPFPPDVDKDKVKDLVNRLTQDKYTGQVTTKIPSDSQSISMETAESTDGTATGTEPVKGKRKKSSKAKVFPREEKTIFDRDKFYKMGMTKEQFTEFTRNRPWDSLKQDVRDTILLEASKWLTIPAKAILNRSVSDAGSTTGTSKTTKTTKTVKTSIPPTTELLEQNGKLTAGETRDKSIKRLSADEKLDIFFFHADWTKKHVPYKDIYNFIVRKYVIRREAIKPILDSVRSGDVFRPPRWQIDSDLEIDILKHINQHPKVLFNEVLTEFRKRGIGRLGLMKLYKKHNIPLYSHSELLMIRAQARRKRRLEEKARRRNESRKLRLTAVSCQMSQTTDAERAKNEREVDEVAIRWLERSHGELNSLTGEGRNRSKNHKSLKLNSSGQVDGQDQIPVQDRLTKEISVSGPINKEEGGRTRKLNLTPKQKFDIYQFYMEMKCRGKKKKWVYDIVRQKYPITYHRMHLIIIQVEDGKIFENLRKDKSQAHFEGNKIRGELVNRVLAFERDNPALSIAAIAKHFNISRSTVSYFFRKNSIPRLGPREMRAMRLAQEGKEYTPRISEEESRRVNAMRRERKRRLKLGLPSVGRWPHKNNQEQQGDDQDTNQAEYGDGGDGGPSGGPQSVSVTATRSSRQSAKTVPRRSQRKAAISAAAASGAAPGDETLTATDALVGILTPGATVVVSDANYGVLPSAVTSVGGSQIVYLDLDNFQ